MFVGGRKVGLSKAPVVNPEVDDRQTNRVGRPRRLGVEMVEPVDGDRNAPGSRTQDPGGRVGNPGEVDVDFVLGQADKVLFRAVVAAGAVAVDPAAGGD